MAEKHPDPDVQRRLEQIDREYEEQIAKYDPKKALEETDILGEKNILLGGDSEARQVIGPYQDHAKQIVKKLLDNKDDVLVRDVIDEYTMEARRAYKSKGYDALDKGKFQPVWDTVYALTQDMVRDAVEHGDVEPSDLTDHFLNADTYGRPRMNYRKLREALEGLPDGR